MTRFTACAFLGVSGLSRVMSPRPFINPLNGRIEMAIATTKTRKLNLCLTGSGETCKGDFAGLGMDARVKSRLVKLARGLDAGELPTKQELKDRGYTQERMALVPHGGMTSEQAKKILEARGWGRFIGGKGDTSPSKREQATAPTPKDRVLKRKKRTKTTSKKSS